MRFTKLVSSKTTSVDRHIIFEYKHTSCSNTRKMTTRHQVLILCNKGPEKHEFLVRYNVATTLGMPPFQSIQVFSPASVRCALERREESSVMWRHSCDRHGGNIPEFTMNVTGTLRDDAMLRQVTESVIINKIDERMLIKLRPHPKGCCNLVGN